MFIFISVSCDLIMQSYLKIWSQKSLNNMVDFSKVCGAVERLVRLGRVRVT